MTLTILYQDEHLVAINKPAGLLVHSSLIDAYETKFAVNLLQEQLSQKVYPVHRLDKPTSGVLLFALDSGSANHLAQQFERHQVAKTYWALVRGYLLGKGEIDYAYKPRLDKIADKHKTLQAKPALTTYESLGTLELPFATQARFTTSRYSLMALYPKTGRKHQLRRHLSHIHHPIVGDTTYGDTTQNRAILAHFGVGRLMLHAKSLALIHPFSKALLTIDAPLDDDFAKIVASVVANA